MARSTRKEPKLVGYRQFLKRQPMATNDFAFAQSHAIVDLHEPVAALGTSRPSDHRSSPNLAKVAKLSRVSICSNCKRSVIV
jgi:hypothetical protein